MKRFLEEWLLLRREGIVPVALAAFVLLHVAAALNARSLLDARAATAAGLQAEATTLESALAAQALRGAGAATDPGSVGYSVLERTVVLPTGPLAALAVGQSDVLPAHYEISARGAHQFLTRTELDSPLRLSIGNFDVAFVVVWLLPLLAIGLAYGVVSAERESGVLALAVACGASARNFVLGKWWGRFAIAAAVLALASLASLAVAGSLRDLDGGRLALTGAWLLAVTLYLLFWFALALWINVRGGPSDGHAATLVGLWLAFVILAPALSNLAATTAFAAPSRVELTTELREATEAADRAAAAARDRYFFDHPEMQGRDLDQHAYFLSVARSEASVARAMLPLLDRFERQAAAQQRLVELLQYLSPGTLVYQALTALAGTDGHRHREFRAQTREFHQRWSAFFATRLESGTSLDAADYGQLPRFRFADEPVGARLGRVALPLAVLAAMCATLLGLALRGLARLAVTGS